MRRHYYAKITTVYEQLGKVLDALERKGPLKTSTIIGTKGKYACRPMTLPTITGTEKPIHITGLRKKGLSSEPLSSSWTMASGSCITG